MTPSPAAPLGLLLLACLAAAVWGQKVRACVHVCMCDQNGTEYLRIYDSSQASQQLRVRLGSDGSTSTCMHHLRPTNPKPHHHTTPPHHAADTKHAQQQVTFLLNAESCEETTFNQAFTRTAVANSSCALIPGLDHVSLECTGTNGTATGYMWGILNTEVRYSSNPCTSFCSIHRPPPNVTRGCAGMLVTLTNRTTERTHAPPRQCDPDFGRPTVNLTLYDGCNVRIGGTLVSAYLEGKKDVHVGRHAGPVVIWRFCVMVGNGKGRSKFRSHFEPECQSSNNPPPTYLLHPPPRLSCGQGQGQEGWQVNQLRLTDPDGGGSSRGVLD